jgi:hypothetical protein
LYTKRVVFSFNINGLLAILRIPAIVDKSREKSEQQSMLVSRKHSARAKAGAKKWRDDRGLFQPGNPGSPGRPRNSGALGMGIDQAAQIGARVSNETLLEIQRRAAHELVSISAYVRAVLEEKLLKDRDP